VTYQPLTYREQGGDKFVVASGGEIDVESGGSLKIAGTAVTATAAQLNRVEASAETVENAVSSTAGSTSFVAISGSGITILSCTGSTATSVCGFILAAPVAGVRKTIIAGKGIDATHDARVDTHAAGTHVGYAASNRRMSFDALDEAIELVGISTTQWGIVQNLGSVTLATT